MVCPWLRWPPVTETQEAVNSAHMPEVWISAIVASSEMDGLPSFCYYA